MIFDSGNSTSRRTAPHARGGWSVPDSPAPVSTRRRRVKTYSDPQYELAVYLTKGKPLERYKVLDKYENQRLPYIQASIEDRTILTANARREKRLLPALGTKNVPARERIVVANEALAVEYKVDRGLGRIQPNIFFSYFNNFRYLNALRTIFTQEYFYANVFWYWVIWFCFYCQEYLYVQISMYFPLLDWFFQIPFFYWPVSFELHFWRLILVLMGLTFLIFAVSQYFVSRASPIEHRLNLLHFMSFFGSVLFYYLTGLAPFIFFIFLTFIILLYYNLMYYIPVVLDRAPAPPAPLLLAPPAQPVDHPKLPIFYYRYPFSPLSVREPNKTVKRFTHFPFLTVSHRSTASKYVFDLKRMAGFFPVPWQAGHASFFNTGRFSETFNCNPYETYERYRFERSHTPHEDKGSPTYLTYKYPLRGFITFPRRLMWGPTLEPLGGSTVSYLESKVPSPARSIFKDYLTGGTSRDPFGFPRFSRFTHQRLMADPYFRLGLWLKQIAPLYHAEAPKSRFNLYFLTPEPTVKKSTGETRKPLIEKWVKNDSIPYRMLRFFFYLFYQVFVTLMVFVLTLGYFSTPLPTKAENLRGYIKLLTKAHDRLTVLPSIISVAYAQSILRLVSNFSSWLYTDVALGPRKSSFVGNWDLHHDLLVALDDLVQVLERAYQPFFPTRRALYFTLTIRKLWLCIYFITTPGFPVYYKPEPTYLELFWKEVKAANTPFPMPPPPGEPEEAPSTKRAKTVLKNVMGPTARKRNSRSLKTNAGLVKKHDSKHRR